MLCQICNKRPANVHMTKIVNGEKTELHICEQCAREKENNPMNDAPFSFSNIISSLMDFSGSGAMPYTPKENIKCPQCGLDYAEFKKTGRFGCSNCYESFGNRLEPLLKRIHGNTQHTGKVPKRTGGIIKIKRDIEKLRYELKRAIDNEEYEKAAELRDKIKNLESQDMK
ncbi:UvrB/uvrC motif protein [Oxobacter pfennigii]|uniref:UvrB/uvrC motif protein n=1 Tax=Oxobacter pfennigii TaxID=36849 RepID=A0A0P8WWK2_9CLOT|nr:UvrB/UvrC motif-containing protein [Oxobacter pfennigii]KPU42665.1 UvrB/uvrC motif protein [Oxobacter pfennigii]